MDAWAAIRRRACACREEAAGTGATTAAGLLEAAFAAVKLGVREFGPGEPGFPLGLRGRLEREPRLVYVSRTLASGEREEVLAHELGHFHLHEDPLLEDRIETGAAERGRRLSGYSPREVKERQADAFAAEFLCPSQDVRGEVIERGTPASAVAQAHGVSVRLALRQATAALLRPPSDAPASVDASPEPELGADLERLAAWDGPALLVSGSGGTGKTSALRARLRHLAATGVPPAQLLVLVRSEEAAEAVRETLSGTRAAFASETWIGTPRGLGLEIVSRWAEAIPRQPDFRILGAGDARRLVASCATRVRGLQGLPPPSERDATAAMRAIRLAKATDGRIEPSAVDPDVVAAYEDALRAANAVDVGDLVPTAARILGERPDALGAAHDQFRHVVIDDAQDLTPAAARLVDLVAHPGATLWAARDPTSAIQAFQGAAPDAIAALVARRGGREETLLRPRAAWGAAWGAELRFRQWLARPGSRSWPIGGLKVPLSVAPDEDGEARAVAAQIEAMRRDGIPYREQVVLGRSHATINRMAPALDRAGIPVLHLGDLRERDDVRSLLGLLETAVEGTSARLPDVARMGRYRMPPEHVEAIRQWCEAHHGGSLRPVLAAPDEVPGVDPETRAVLSALGDDLAGFGRGSSPFEVLATWLFDRTRRRDRPELSVGLRTRLSLVATHHVLMVCQEAEGDGECTPAGVSGRIDRIGSLDQDTHFRKTSLPGLGLDAVAVMTFHAAQGRQYRARAPRRLHGRAAIAGRRRRGGGRVPGRAIPLDRAAAPEPAGETQRTVRRAVAVPPRDSGPARRAPHGAGATVPTDMTAARRSRTIDVRIVHEPWKGRSEMS